MNTSAFGLNAQVVDSTKKYRDSFYTTTAGSVDSTQTVLGPLTDDENNEAKESVRQKLNENLKYAIGNWDNAMINVSNTFRRIGVATATLEEVDNQLQTAQDTYIEGV